MNTSDPLDRDSFQKLLACAFAVQESRVDCQSLSAIVEFERLIKRGGLDADGALQLIAEHTRNVANATGVAVGLLAGDQLVYRAGSGSGSAFIGKRLMAALTASADTNTAHEILRVEDAVTDPRIEGAICRQLGARSLLILMIHHDHKAAGVLEVLFNEAHAFQEGEVRTYRLMAGLVGEAMSRSAQLEEKKRRNRSTELPATPLAMRAPAKETAAQRWEAPTPKFQMLNQSPGLGTVIMRGLARLSWPRHTSPRHTRRMWSVALPALATVLLVVFWIASSARRPAPTVGSSAPPAIEQPASLPGVQAISAAGTSRLHPAPVFRKRVRVGENVIEYIGDDVTVRHFGLKPAPRRLLVGDNDHQVHHIGDDVTVRYFMPSAAVASPTGGGVARPVLR
jgi:hypothetical protein